jgi:16S rRNA processing protein RimM
VSNSSHSRVLLAHVAGAHGIRGEVMLKSYAEDADTLKSYGPLSDEAGARSFQVTGVRATAKGVIVRIKGIADRTAAEALRGIALYVDRAALPTPDDGTYYNCDLIGLAAETAAGERIGSIVAVENFGAGPLLEIRRAGARDTEYVPFTDAFVPTVDIAGGRVVVDMPIMIGEPEPNSGRDDADDA